MTEKKPVSYLGTRKRGRFHGNIEMSQIMDEILPSN
jgi:hypothetical protein